MRNFAIQPLFPGDPKEILIDISTDLISKSSFLAGTMRPQIQESVAELVRSVNCYYSNRLEGHPTTPRDIDAALRESYSNDPKTRDLQREAISHIDTQRKIDNGTLDLHNPASEEFLKAVHYEFCSKLPPEMLVVRNPDTDEKIDVVPGEFRDGSVIVGKHIPPTHTDITYYLELFEQTYDLSKLNKIKRVIATAASHHRFVWIHPFYDGNGRVARLYSHAFFLKIGVGNSLWSVSRGLGRTAELYKSRLAAADEPRHGDLDGRGALSDKQLFKFCRYFLECAVDQIDYMTSVLDPQTLDQRIVAYCQQEMALGNLPKTSDRLLRTALYHGEVHRGEAPAITGYQERRARDVLTTLIHKNLLVSTGPRKPVRLGFPSDVADRWFPKLYSS
jgi:Fic family protein